MSDKSMGKRPCHVCLRIVAHYNPGGRQGSTAWRGSVPHKCPHGQQCRGGHRLLRWGHMGYAPNCKPCPLLMRDRNEANAWAQVALVNGIGAPDDSK